MSDKRTTELTTINAVVALNEGFLVVDTLALQSIDAEQQNILIKTLLDYYALSAADFNIGDLNIKKVSTIDNSTTEVLLVDTAGNVRVRDINQLLQGTAAVDTTIVNVFDETVESIERAATNQFQINVQNVGQFAELQDQIDNIVNLGATGTVRADPLPQPIQAAESDCTFITLFPSNNDNVLEFDDTQNIVICKATGIYELQVFLQLDGTIPAAGEVVTLRILDADTLVEIGAVEIQVPEDGWSGTIMTRWPVLSAPQNIKFTKQALADDNVSILEGQCSVSSINTAGIPEIINPFFVDVFGQDDVLQDRLAIVDAIASAAPYYVIRLFGTFAIEESIPIVGTDNLTIDCRAAQINFTTSLATTQLFEITTSSQINFLYPNFSMAHTSAPTELRGIYVTDTSEQINVFGGTIIKPITPTDLVAVSLGNNSSITALNAQSADIRVNATCRVVNCIAGNILATSTANVITGNNANVSSVDIATNEVKSNLNQSLSSFQGAVGFGINTPAERVHVVGNIQLTGALKNRTNSFVTFVDYRNVSNGNPVSFGYDGQGGLFYNATDEHNFNNPILIESSRPDQLYLTSSGGAPYISYNNTADTTNIELIGDALVNGSTGGFIVRHWNGGSTDSITADINGQVGILNSAPDEALDVTGNIKIRNTTPFAQTLQIFARAEELIGGSWFTMSQAQYINLVNESESSPFLEPPTRFIVWGRKVGNPTDPTDTNGDYVGLAPYKNYGADGDANGDPIVNGNFDPSLGVSVYKTGQVAIGWNGIFYADFLNPVGNHAAQAAMFNVATLSNTKNNPADTIPYVASFRDRQKSMSILYRSAAQTKQMTLNNSTGEIEWDANIVAPIFKGSGLFNNTTFTDFTIFQSGIQVGGNVEITSPTDGFNLLAPIDGGGRYGLKYGSAGNIGDIDLMMLTNRAVSGEVAIGACTSTGGASGEVEVIRFKVDNSNNKFVGIGTTTPTETLEVIGNVKATAFIGNGSQITGLPVSGAVYLSAAIEGATGNILTSQGAAFTVNRNAAGNYTVTHNIGDLDYWVSYQVINETPGDFNYIIQTLNGKNTNFFTLVITNLSATLTDKNFDIVIFR